MAGDELLEVAVAAITLTGILPSSIIFSFLISSMYYRNKASFGSSFILGLFWIFLALFAYLRVLNVSS